jgi:hypothetical protein
VPFVRLPSGRARGGSAKPDGRPSTREGVGGVAELPQLRHVLDGALRPHRALNTVKGYIPAETVF